MNDIIRRSGTVVWFDDARGYGFIHDDIDYFVHYSQIIGTQRYKSLVDGSPVQFAGSITSKGYQAHSVVIVQGV